MSNGASATQTGLSPSVEPVAVSPADAASIPSAACPLGSAHGMASTYRNESGNLCCDWCGVPIDSVLPPYDDLVADVFEGYLKHLVGWEDAGNWARLPATWRWHEFWDRLASAIETRSAETAGLSPKGESAGPKDDAQVGQP